jgi:HAD superfamily hydrolase (TIGR01509 family)
MPSRAAVDAVTIDALGTLLELDDPTERLRTALSDRGFARSRREVADAFAREVEHYLPRAPRGHDRESLAGLRKECVAVFLAAARAEIDVDEFVPAFLGALEFRLLPGAAEALRELTASGLRLACVSNWDYALPDELDRLGVLDHFETVVTSAEARATKPEPPIFALALDRLAVPAERTLHVGDTDADRDGAAAAGLGFEPPPLATLPARLGLR